MPARYRAIFFDLDGTLIEERSGVGETRAAVVAALRGHGHAVAEAAYADAAEAVIQALLAANDGAWPAVFSRLDAIRATLERLALPADLAEELADVHGRARLEHVTLTDGAAAAVAWAGESHRLGLISNGPGPEQREKLRRTGLAAYFQSVTISGEAGVAKPDPAIFARALTALCVAPAESVYVGNNFHADVCGALTAGMDAVWLRGSGVRPPDRAVRGYESIGTMRDLPASLAARESKEHPP